MGRAFTYEKGNRGRGLNIWSGISMGQRGKVLTSGFLVVQYCTPALWAGIIAQVQALSRTAEGLPEEALTQVFQVRTLKSNASVVGHAHR
jgi:hypothetical protein